MAIILRKPDGSERTVAEGKPYRLEPGEYIAGSDGNGTVEADKQFDSTISPLISMLGVNLAEFITLASAALGIEKCARCQWRDKFLRRMGELGVRETTKRLFSTLKKDWKPDVTD